MRMLLMRYFQWSPQTIDAVYNPGNCDMWVLRKRPGTRRYEIAPPECSPPRMPWATRRINVYATPESVPSPPEPESVPLGTAPQPRGVAPPEPYTIVDYLALPQPRTSQGPMTLARHLIKGHDHQLDPNTLPPPVADELAERIVEPEPEP